MLNVVNKCNKNNVITIEEMSVGDVGICENNDIVMKIYSTSISGGDNLILLNHYSEHNPLILNYNVWKNYQVTLVKATLTIENKN